jgi:hypothetical protein
MMALAAIPVMLNPSVGPPDTAPEDFMSFVYDRPDPVEAERGS